MDWIASSNISFGYKYNENLGNVQIIHNVVKVTKHVFFSPGMETLTGKILF